ncbi:hypothetical protein [Bernardetia sp.]|uniref:hypothetical protein n=1 Tax=Bernardetia sp. TaxID=1937974 RepID=UPI0025C27AA9|nr:hypothetical protein [Bernardetia sp.]
MNLLSKINNLFFKKKDNWHWNNPFEKGTESYELYEKGANNYSKYTSGYEMVLPTTFYKVEVWIEGYKLKQSYSNRFYPRLYYADKEEAIIIAIQTALFRKSDIENYRIILSIHGQDKMEIPIY